MHPPSSPPPSPLTSSTSSPLTLVRYVLLTCPHMAQAIYDCCRVLSLVAQQGTSEGKRQVASDCKTLFGKACARRGEAFRAIGNLAQAQIDLGKGGKLLGDAAMERARVLLSRQVQRRQLGAHDVCCVFCVSSWAFFEHDLHVDEAVALAITQGPFPRCIPGRSFLFSCTSAGLGAPWGTHSHAPRSICVLGGP